MLFLKFIESLLTPNVYLKKENKFEKKSQNVWMNKSKFIAAINVVEYRILKIKSLRTFKQGLPCWESNWSHFGISLKQFIRLSYSSDHNQHENYETTWKKFKNSFSMMVSPAVTGFLQIIILVHVCSHKRSV